MEFSELVRSRRSVRHYLPDVSIDDAELAAIFEEVLLSPSSFNMQHWQFVVVRDQARKTTLRGLSYGQAQVESCAAVVLVCGRTDAWQDAARVYADAPDDVREKYVPMIEGAYKGQPSLERDEVIRSGALAAMSLMYAARNRGWDSGPMIGFDAGKVAAELGLPATVLPVMMVVLGKADSAQLRERAYRRPLDEVVHSETWGGGGLSFDS